MNITRSNQQAGPTSSVHHQRLTATALAHSHLCLLLVCVVGVMSRYWTKQLLTSSLSDVVPPASTEDDDDSGNDSADRSLSKSEAEIEATYGGSGGSGSGGGSGGSGSAATNRSDSKRSGGGSGSGGSSGSSGGTSFGVSSSPYATVFGRSDPFALVTNTRSSGNRAYRKIAGGSQYSGGAALIDDSKVLAPGQDFDALRCRCGQSNCNRMYLKYSASTDRMNRVIGRGGSGLYAGPQLRGRFVPLGCDDATREFLHESYGLHNQTGFSVCQNLKPSHPFAFSPALSPVGVYCAYCPAVEKLFSSDPQFVVCAY